MARDRTNGRFLPKREITKELHESMQLKLFNGATIESLIKEFNISERKIREWITIHNLQHVIETRVNRLTNDQKTTLLMLYKTEKRLARLSQLLNIPKDKIQRFLKKQNLTYIASKAKITKELEDKIIELSKINSIKDICRILKISNTPVRNVLKRHNIISKNPNIKITKEVESKIDDLIKKGKIQAEICDELNIASSTLNHFLKRTYDQYPLDTHSGSSTKEFEVINEIKKFYSGDVIHRYKLNGIEVDIYIPDKKLGIEYCGLYWHTVKYRKRNNKIIKARFFKKNDIRTIFIFEDEWHNRKNQILNFLKSILLYQTKINARDCKIKTLSKSETNQFLERTHIQGSTENLLISFGLLYNNELIGVMTGNRHHRQKQSELVLGRMSFKDGVTVIGGASKLFKQLKEYGKCKDYSKIISWSDNRWSEGNVYKQLGFMLEKTLAPDYSYVKNKKRISKQSLKKTVEERLVDKTEKELREDQGLLQIYDCGKKRWVYEL